MAKLKLNNKLQENICNEIKVGTPEKHAAISHGISKSTFYNWYNKGKGAKYGKFKNFYDAVEEAKSVAIALRVRRIHKAGEKGNWQADAWWLERVANDEFGRKDKVNADIEHKGKLEVKNTFEKIKEYEDYFDELDKQAESSTASNST